MAHTDRHTRVRETWPRRTILLMTGIVTLITCIAGAAILLFYRSAVNREQYRMEVRQTALLNNSVDSVFTSLFGVVGDLSFWANHYELRALFLKSKEIANSGISQEYLAFATHKRIYDQVRLLDANGKEIVRVNYRGGDPYVVPADKLQDKHLRYYFSEVAQSGGNAIYMSAFDLNVENEKIERPFNPMIRFSHPVFCKDGRLRGVVVLNYRGQQIINQFKHRNNVVEGDLMLADADGYWLYHPDASMTWGFMLPERSEAKMAHAFPSEWKRMVAGVEGRFATKNGLFAYQAVFPGRSISQWRDIEVKVNPRSKKWLFIHHVPNAVLDSMLGPLRRNLLILWAFMAFGSIGPAWLLAVAILRRREARRQLVELATFDTLTGLLNRASFMRELEQSVAESTRFRRRFALLYLDLDGFKPVNDTLGHDAGDLVLKQTAERFQHTIRSSDVVARLGGDEFCIIVRNVENEDTARFVANKLIDALRTPFELSGKTGQVGTSIGVACFPEDANTAALLLKRADEAMYAAKSSGKKRVCFAQAVSVSQRKTKQRHTALGAIGGGDAR